MPYTSDFETTTDVNDCRVWACGICSIDEKLEFFYGNSIEYLFDFFKRHPNETYYFHNLKFDGEFIFYHLLSNLGFKHVKEKRKLKAKEFSTLISDSGQFYSIEIRLSKRNKVTIYDSLKIIPLEVEEMARSFGLSISKLKIDYTAKREKGHQLTLEEIEYLKNDVTIVAQALNTLFHQNLKKMTQGANALFDFKNIISEKNFKRYFPILEYDEYIRASYKGGYVYVNPHFQKKDIDDGIVLDVNSLYPSVMYSRLLPYGEGIYFTGRYEYDREYPLYVQTLRCTFELKKGYIPTIQLKNNLSFMPNEYLTSSNGDDVTLTLTSVDLKIFLEHYDVDDLEYFHGYKFKGSDSLFKDYIDKWIKVKIEATETGNKGMRQLAKLMLNALYGKFGLNPNVRSKYPYLSDDGSIKYQTGEKEHRDPIYIPMAVFITAYAREITITSAQKCMQPTEKHPRGRFIYCDTDSLHLLGTEIPDFLEVHETKLGAWAHESTFTRARFIRQKTYIEEIEGQLNITCAGMPKKCYKDVTWDNFNEGLTVSGKLLLKHVKGGIVLVPTPFTIK